MRGGTERSIGEPRNCDVIFAQTLRPWLYNDNCKEKRNPMILKYDCFTFKIHHLSSLAKGGVEKFFLLKRGRFLAILFLKGGLKRAFPLLLAWTLIGLCGCATLGKTSPEVSVEHYFEQYLQKGWECEVNGYLVQALKQYKLAMTVNPLSHVAIDSVNRVEKKLRSSAEKHYKAGIKLNNEGKYGQGRQQYLIALRLWPNYPQVIRALTTRKRIQIKRYIMHTVKPGESVSKLAKMYYGDSQKFSIIAKYNNFSDATRIDVGQRIKIPEIEGVAFFAGKEPIETEPLGLSDPEFAEWDWEEFSLEEMEEPVDQVAIYRNHGIDLFRKNEYQMAIVEFNKVLNAQPDDSMALLYSFMSHYQLAMDLYNKKDYLGARDQFQASLRYRQDCYKCKLYIRKSEDLYKDKHYKIGIRLFDKEQLKEAIKEWELVRLIDSDYKKVNVLINKARTLLKKIDELKESQKG